MNPGATAVIVSGWIGSRNAGDELVHAGLRRLLAERGAVVSAVTLDAGATVGLHGGTATTRIGAVLSLAGGRRAALVLGGGGLLQDQTSAANLPYHLLPVVAARARGRPVVGVGLGAGPLSSIAARRLLVRSLAGVDLTVRDGPSADLLAALGLRRPSIGADLALALPDTCVEAVRDVLAVALRPWDLRRHYLPVSLRAQAPPAGELVGRLAAAVDATAARLGLAVRFVAFDTDKDEPLHRAVAERLRADVVDMLAPNPFAALAAVAGARAVVAMRYHAGIAALLGRRPAVLVAYDPKVRSLAADVGAGFRVTSSDLREPAVTADAAARAVAEAETGVLDTAVARLRARGAANGAALDRLLDASR